MTRGRAIFSRRNKNVCTTNRVAGVICHATRGVTQAPPICICLFSCRIIVLLEKGNDVWDDELLIHERASLETLVRVGMGVGWGRADA